MKLNLGAGGRPLPGYVNVDRVLPADRITAEIRVDAMPGALPFVEPGTYAWQRWDLDEAPWPWPDESVSEIVARDVFEHVDDAIVFMTECWRVLAPYNLLAIRTPHVSCLDAFTDPTHKRFPTQFTFDYWIPGTVLFEANNNAYGGVAFQRVHMELVTGSLELTLRKLPHGDLGSGPT